MLTFSRLIPVFLLLIAICFGCQQSSSPISTPAVSSAASTSISVASPKKQSLTWTIDQPGSVQAFESAPIESRVSGYMQTVHVDIGDEVHAATMDGKPATVLAQLDVPDLVQEVERKRAFAKSAKAEAEAARKLGVVAEAQVKIAVAILKESEALVIKAQADVERWESELDRVEKLIASGSGTVDRQTRDETKRQAEAARAARLATEARVEASRASIAEAEAKKGAAEAAVSAAEARVTVADTDTRRAEVEQGFATFRAPFNGVITARNVHAGHLIKPGISPPLFTVARLDQVRVFVDVPEVTAEHARPGSPVEVRVPSINRVISGKEIVVTRTSQAIHPESRTLRTEIDLKNQDLKLRPGMYVLVRLTATIPETLTLPPASVLFADETAYCFAIEEGKAIKLQLRVGRVDPLGIQILAKRRAGIANAEWQPLTGNEKVAVGNLGALNDGQSVLIKAD